MRRSGVVVEIGPKNQVIVLTSQGEFVKVPFKKHVQVGQEIRFDPKRERLSIWQLGLAATLFLTLLGTWPLLTENLAPTTLTPEFVITLDMDSSLELQIAENREVLKIEGLNRDGRELASNLNVVGDDLQTALTKIASQAEKMGYAVRSQDEVVVTIASQRNQAVELTESMNRGGGTGAQAEIERAVVDAFESRQLAQVRIWEVPRSLQTEAKLAGITPSRYLAIQMPSTSDTASPVIPQRPETRLTMGDPSEAEEAVNSLGRTPSLQASVDSAKPALTPARWTGDNLNPARRADLYNIDFSVTGFKGDL